MAMLQSFMEDGEYGFMNENGEVVIPPRFDEADEFGAGGVAAVRLGDQWGLIDQNGQTIIPFEYDHVYAFSKSWVHAKKAKTEYLFTTTGEKLLEMPDILHWDYPEEGLIRVKKQTGWGCVDMTGKTLIPFQYKSLGPCRNGWLSFFQDGSWGWLNKEGAVMVPPSYLEVGHWNDACWWCRDHAGYRFFNYGGVAATHEIWQKILLPLNGIGAVRTAAGWRYIDNALNTVLQLPPRYEWVEHYSEGLAAVKRDGKWGYIDARGNEVIAPAYRNVKAFREGFAAVAPDHLWGFINSGGAPVIPAAYEGVASFKNGRALVWDRWSEWYIDQQGRQVSEPKYTW